MAPPEMELAGNWAGGLALDWHRKFRYGDWRRAACGNPRTALGDLVYELKFGGSSAAASTLGQLLSEAVGSQAIPRCLLIPVPGTPRRGWQPSVMLARVMSGHLAWPICEDVFSKRDCEASTREMPSIAAKRSHLKQNFALLTPPNPGPLGIMLIDDVVSTGVTFEVAIELLASFRTPVYVAAATRGD